MRRPTIYSDRPLPGWWQQHESALRSRTSGSQAKIRAAILRVRRDDRSSAHAHGVWWLPALVILVFASLGALVMLDRSLGLGGYPVTVASLAFGIFATIFNLRERRRIRARFRPDTCTSCGHDCTGLPAGASGVIKCPECGRRAAFPARTGEP